MQSSDLLSTLDGTRLDADTPDTVRLSATEAAALGIGAMRRLGYSEEDAKLVVAQLVENALCGYQFASLPRILAIAADVRTRSPQQPIKIVRETPTSALINGGNHLGYISVHFGTRIAIDKAKRHGFSMVGIYNSHSSGRNAYFVEMIAKEGMVGIHSASTIPRVLPLGGSRPGLGTNPISVGFPSSNGPVILDMSTASITTGEVMLAAHLGVDIPEGIGFDEHGNPSCNPNEVLKGGWLPFGGHRGYGLSFAVQALGLLAGAALARGEVQDYGFLLLVLDPNLMLADNAFPAQMAELVRRIKLIPPRSGVDEIRIPSERAFRERSRRLQEGVVFDRKTIDSLNAL
jgi:LDH2 family malate/lactate/ureidoglycolate dehydrogenase